MFFRQRICNIVWARRSGAAPVPQIAMAYREFADDDGRKWEAWDVQPAPRGPRYRDAANREGAKLASQAPAHVLNGWESGWLAFYCDGTSRRLRPIPPGWETISEEELRRLLMSAAHVEPRNTPT